MSSAVALAYKPTIARIWKKTSRAPLSLCDKDDGIKRFFNLFVTGSTLGSISCLIFVRGNIVF